MSSSCVVLSSDEEPELLIDNCMIMDVIISEWINWESVTFVSKGKREKEMKRDPVNQVHRTVLEIKRSNVGGEISQSNRTSIQTSPRKVNTPRSTAKASSLNDNFPRVRPNSVVSGTPKESAYTAPKSRQIGPTRQHPGSSGSFDSRTQPTKDSSNVKIQQYNGLNLLQIKNSNNSGCQTRKDATPSCSGRSNSYLGSRSQTNSASHNSRSQQNNDTCSKRLLGYSVPSSTSAANKCYSGLVNGPRESGIQPNNSSSRSVQMNNRTVSRTQPNGCSSVPGVETKKGSLVQQNGSHLSQKKREISDDGLPRIVSLVSVTRPAAQTHPKNAVRRAQDMRVNQSNAKPKAQQKASALATAKTAQQGGSGQVLVSSRRFSSLLKKNGSTSEKTVRDDNDVIEIQDLGVTGRALEVEKNKQDCQTSLSVNPIQVVNDPPVDKTDSSVSFRTEILPMPGTSRTSSVKIIQVANTSVSHSTPSSTASSQHPTSSTPSPLSTSTPTSSRSQLSLSEKFLSSPDTPKTSPVETRSNNKAAESSRNKPEYCENMSKEDLEVRGLFQGLLDACRELDKSTDIEMVHKKMWLYYMKTDPTYLRGPEFKKLLEKETKKCLQAKQDKEECDPYCSFKKLLEAMKSNPYLGTSKLRKLNRMLKKVKKKIAQLEQAEVTSSGDEEDAYIQMDRWSRRAVQIYKKICELMDKPADAERQFLRKVSFSGNGEYQVISQALARYYNKCRKFPDFQDVKKLVESVVKKENLKLTPIATHTMAEKIFVDFGTMLQRLRCYDDYTIMVEHLNEEEVHDPAMDDPELERKLNENKRLYHKNEQKVLEEYTNKELMKKSVEKTDASEDKGNEEDESCSENEDTEGSDEEDNMSKQEVNGEKDEKRELREVEGREKIVQEEKTQDGKEELDVSKNIEATNKRSASEDVTFNPLKRHKGEEKDEVRIGSAGGIINIDMGQEEEDKFKTETETDSMEEMTTFIPVNVPDSVTVKKVESEETLKTYNEARIMQEKMELEEEGENKYKGVEEPKTVETDPGETDGAETVYSSEKGSPQIVDVIDGKEDGGETCTAVEQPDRTTTSSDFIDLADDSPDEMDVSVISDQRRVEENCVDISKDDDDEVTVIETFKEAKQTVSVRSDNVEGNISSADSYTRTQIIIEGRHPVVLTESSAIFISRSAKFSCFLSAHYRLKTQRGVVSLLPIFAFKECHQSADGVRTDNVHAKAGCRLHLKRHPTWEAKRWNPPFVTTWYTPQDSALVTNLDMI
ncbi:hypothetical protein AAG570_011417 [Ranatra chinensis]|uniref:Daxx histone-binding domain-containing protein n=1 Tax=Ranatra chinensis TaxID=642074 RepID=A0ABD0YKL9_9HEMI